MDMDRRKFLGTCAAVAGGAAVAGAAKAQGAAPVEGKTLKHPKLRIAVQPGIYKDMSIGQRLEKLAGWGAAAYEWLNPEGDMAELRRIADSVGLPPSVIGGVGAIAPGQMVLPIDHDRLEQQFRDRIALAKRLGCTRLIGLTGNTRDDASYDEQMANVIAFLKRIDPIARENDVLVVMEALNPLVDHQGYFLTRTDQTMEILKAVDSPNIKMLFDIYHQQITEGNVIRNFTENIDRIGHFHVADNPGRHEPGTGELNYVNIFKAIVDTGYDGYVGLEFGPSKGPDEALSAVADILAQV
jgi:hydroxypyruvate isomerase